MENVPDKEIQRLRGFGPFFFFLKVREKISRSLRNKEIQRLAKRNKEIQRLAKRNKEIQRLTGWKQGNATIARSFLEL